MARRTSIVAILVFLCVGTAIATAWSNTGPSWTTQQARIALITTPRLIARDHKGNVYVFGIFDIRSIRGSGPMVRISGRSTWRLFEVRAVADPMAGDWVPDASSVSFCLHVKGPRPRTIYPYSPYVLTGFDHVGAAFGAKGWGCRDTPQTRYANGAHFHQGLLPAPKPPAPPPSPPPLRIASIDSGDSLTLTSGQRVRLLQIDAPDLDTDECYARSAKSLHYDFAPRGRTPFTLESDPKLPKVDGDGRLLRYVMWGGRPFNTKLVREGIAAPYFPGGKRGKYADELMRAALEAKAGGRGLWRACPDTVLDPNRPVDTGPRGG